MGFLNLFKNKEKKQENDPARQAKDDQERTADGTPVYRYEEQENAGWRPAPAPLYAEEIEAHFDKMFPGRESSVFHEIVSDLVHIDLHVMRPSAEENFCILYTTGMSDLPMTLPAELVPEYKHLERAELMMFLPGDWNFGGNGTVSSDMADRDYWPLGVLKFLARFPHEYKTWLGYGHTIPNGADYEPYADNTGLGCALLVALKEEISTVETGDGTPVQVYMMVPVYQEECEYKLENGLDALMERILPLAENPFVLDVQRPNTCA